MHSNVMFLREFNCHIPYIRPDVRSECMESWGLTRWAGHIPHFKCFSYARPYKVVIGTNATIPFENSLYANIRNIRIMSFWKKYISFIDVTPYESISATPSVKPIAVALLSSLASMGNI